MKILGFAGSNSAASINKKLVKYTLNLAKEHECELLDLNSFEVEIYSPERESASGIPQKITEFAQKISNSDLIILSLAEHNGTYSSAFKNIFDWVSRIPNRKVFDGKNLFLMASSPGGRGGQGVLEAAINRFPRDGATILETFSLPSFQDNYSQEGLSEPFDSELKKKLSSILSNA